MTIQEWIHHWEVGAGSKILRAAAAILGFVAVAGLFDALAYQGFSSEEAMESAQLARNLAHGKGYTTQTVRPLSIYLLRQQAAPGQAADVLRHPIPDVTTPPVYPVLLAGLMAVLPFDFIADQYWSFAPEHWIAVFNQVLFFVAVLLLFRLARRMFDARVAWLAAAMMTGSNLFWKFTVSGLSTMWVLVVLLAAVFCLVVLQEREQAMRPGPGSLALAALTGLCIGVGGLSRYSFVWLIVPAVSFIAWVAPRARGKLCAVATAACLLVMGPWIARNIVVSGLCFGTATYAPIEQTAPCPEDVLERSFALEGVFHRVGPLDVVDKFLVNAREIWRLELPRLGGNWVSAFFLVGLLVPFRNPALGRVRVFLLFSMLVFLVVQATGQTHISSDSPEINSENLLVLLAPLVFVFGASLFYTLVDQLHLVTVDVRGAVVGLFLLVTSTPLLISLLTSHSPDPDTPYSPLEVQRVARMMHGDEMMISDIPGAVAWYGDHQCGWLPLNDDQEFYQFNSFKPIKAVFLTQRTTNSRFLTQMLRDPGSWGHFVVECEVHGEVPAGFPLTKAPTGLLPDRMLVSDQARWRLFP